MKSLRVLAYATLAFAGMLGVHAVAPVPAQAQESLPACPQSSEILTTEVPVFVRRGESYTAQAYGDRVSEARVEIWSDVLHSDETLPLDADGDLILVRAAPAETGVLRIRFSWVQDAGTPAACVGTDDHPNIPVVARGAKIGDPETARFTGRYRITKRGDQQRPMWTAVPLCDVLACSANVRSTHGLRGKFTLEDGVYTLVRRAMVGFCELRYSDGGTVKWRAYEIATTTLRVSKSKDGIATQLTGSQRYEYEVPSDRSGVCDYRGTTVVRVSATRRP